MTPETIDYIVSKFGSQSKVAKAIGCDQSTVAYWKKRSTIPAPQQEKLLHAAIRLGIDLKPDDFFRSPQEAA